MVFCAARLQQSACRSVFADVQKPYSVEVDVAHDYRQVKLSTPLKKEVAVSPERNTRSPNLRGEPADLSPWNTSSMLGSRLWVCCSANILLRPPLVTYVIGGLIADLPSLLYT